MGEVVEDVAHRFAERGGTATGAVGKGRDAPALPHRAATSGHAPKVDYVEVRRELLAEPLVKDRVPTFIRKCRDPAQFWQFIKHKLPTYAERREYLWSEFQPLIDLLEARAGSPADRQVGDVLAKFDAESVHAVWESALERRVEEAEGGRPPL